MPHICNVYTLDGIEWEYDGVRYKAAVGSYTLIVEGEVIDKRNANKAWHWMAEGPMEGGENDYPFRDEAMRAAIDFAKNYRDIIHG